MRSKKLAILTTVGLSFALLTGCNAKTAETVVEKEQKVVETSTIGIETGAQVSQLSGKLQANDETILSFEISGLLQKLNAKEGDVIQKGDVLAQLDPKDIELQLQMADVSIQAAQAQIQSANAGVSSAQARFAEVTNGARQQEKVQAKIAVNQAEVAYQNAKHDYDRMKTLLDAGASSQKDLENARLGLANAEKGYENAKQAYSLVLEGPRAEQKKQVEAAVNQASAGKLQADASLKQAQVTKSQAELSLQKTMLKAPFSGVIVAKLVSEGQLVTPGTPIFKISQNQNLKVLLPVPDYEISEWKVGKDVTLSLYEMKKTGKITKIYPATNQNTGTINVEVVVANIDDQKWYPGQVVKAETKLSEKKGLFVPAGAVISAGTNDKPYVFLNHDGKAVKTPVTVGELYGNKLQITSGLSAGDEVITTGSDSLFDGDTVKVEKSGGVK